MRLFTQSHSDTTLVSKTSASSLVRPGPGFAIGIILLFGLASLGFYLGYTSQRDAVADFFIEWRGSQIALQGDNPYSDETTRAIQIGSKGRLVGPGEDQLAFVYPYWRVFYAAPLVFLPYAWASAIWLGFLLAVYAASLYLLTLAQSWRPSTPLAGVAFCVGLLLMFPAFSALMLGQAALLVAALLALVYYGLKSGAPGWAGVALALATVKPQLVLVLLPWLVLRAIGQKQWRFLFGFGLTLSGLAGLSFAFYPAWLGQFIAVATRYPAYKKSLTGPGFLFEWLEASSNLPAWILWLALALAGMWLAWRELRSGSQLFDRAFCAALVLTLLLPPQTNISNPAILALPLALLLAHLDKAKNIKLYYGLIVSLLFGSWLLYFLLYNNFYGLLILSWPIAVGLILWLGYRAKPTTTDKDKGLTNEAQA